MAFKDMTKRLIESNAKVAAATAEAALEARKNSKALDALDAQFMSLGNMSEKNTKVVRESLDSMKGGNYNKEQFDNITKIIELEQTKSNDKAAVIEKQAAAQAAAQKAAIEKQAAAQKAAIEKQTADLAAAIEKQTKATAKINADKDLILIKEQSKSLKNMSEENAAVMADTIAKIEAGDDSPELLQALKELAQTEQDAEDAREAKKKAKEDSSMIAKLSKTMEGLSKSLNESIKGATKGAGIVGLLMMFLNPELLMDGIIKGIEIVLDVFDTIKKVFNGDFGALWDFMKKHPIVSGILLVIATFKAIMFGIGLFTKASALMSSGLLAAAAPFIAIGAAIALAVYSLYKAVEDAVAVFNEGGTIWESLGTLISSFFANLIGLPAEWIAKTIAWVLDLFGANELASVFRNIDPVQSIKDLFTMLGDWLLDLPLKAKILALSVLPKSLGGDTTELEAELKQQQDERAAERARIEEKKEKEAAIEAAKEAAEKEKEPLGTKLGGGALLTKDSISPIRQEQQTNNELNGARDNATTAVMLSGANNANINNQTSNNTTYNSVVDMDYVTATYKFNPAADNSAYG